MRENSDFLEEEWEANVVVRRWSRTVYGAGSMDAWMRPLTRQSR